MQDSATNPYIPQESKQLQRKTETLHSPLKRIASIIAIATAVIAVLIIAGLFFVVPRTTVEDKQARIDLGNVLQPPAQLSRLVPVTSTLGFSLQYDNHLLVSYAETVPVGTASPDYFENDDTRTVRNYDLVRLTPAVNNLSSSDAVADPPNIIVSAQTTADQVQAAAAKPDYKGMSQLSVFVQMNIDKKKAARTTDDGSIVSIDATKPTSRTVNDVSYQYVRFTTQNDNDRISNQKYEDCYFTIQNDQPLSACVINVRPDNISTASLTESVLQTITYQKPTIVDEAAKTATTDAQKTPTATKDTTKTDASTDTTTTDTSSDTPKQNDLIIPTPAYNHDWGSLRSVAKNQPSVVRIGTLYCADLQLKLLDGTTAMTLTNACTGGLSSGTFVSRDGMIVTTGHAIRYDPRAAINGYINFADNQADLIDRLQRILDYLMGAKIIQQSDADYLVLGVQTSNQEALAKIQNIGSLIKDSYITATNESYSYAVQLTDQPITVNNNGGARPTFAYSDTVIEGKYVASDYDASKSVQYTFDADKPTPDVGLIKANGSFQNVPIASGDAIKNGALLSTIGYPTSVASDLNIGKSQNKPIVTSMAVNQTFKQAQNSLISVDTPVVPGTDGGGTFDQLGNLVGLAVYGLSYCPDKQCVSSGTIRSSNELTKLIADKNMSLGNLSDATVAWSKGVDEYFKGNYVAAKSQFDQAGSLNPLNKFAAPLSKLAQSKVGSANDTSLFNQLQMIMIVVVIIMVVLTIGSASLYFFQKYHLDKLRVGHYGAGPSVAPQMNAPVAVAQPAAPYPQQGYDMQPQQQPQMVQQQIPPQPPQYSAPYPEQQIQPQQPVGEQSYAQQPQQAPLQQPQVPPMQNGQAPQQPQPAVRPPDDPFYQ